LTSAKDGSGQLHAPAALSQGKSPGYPLDRRLGGPQSRLGHGGEEKKFQPPAGNRTTTNFMVDNKSFENEIKIKCLGTTVTNGNYIYEEVKSRLNSGMFATIQSSVVCIRVSSLKT
jgi:hypothetical protein